MEFTSRVVGDTLLFAFKGRLSAVLADEFEKQVNENLKAELKNVILNVQGMDYLASSGLRTILELTKRLHARGGKLVLCGVQPPVRQIIALAGFEPYLTIVPTETEAFAQVQG